MPRRASGPPVAESASAASHSARHARSTASSRSMSLAEADLDDRAGVQAAGAGGDVLALLVATAGDVVVPQPPALAAQVVAGEDRHDDHAHHRRLEVAADHHRELVGLALEAERRALDLLVVLELELEQLDHLHRRTGGAGDGDTAVAVGLDDLLHRPMGDQVAGRGTPVAGHHDAVGEAQRRRTSWRGARRARAITSPEAPAPKVDAVAPRPTRSSSSGKARTRDRTRSRRTASPRVY